MTYDCSACPRKCGAEREDYNGGGVCGEGKLPRIARAELHMWEEPCVSGTSGSGTVFFAGCALRCAYCQNASVSLGGYGKEISVQRLREIYFELADKGAHNINLVNPTHFIKSVNESLAVGIGVPILYNTSGYENVSALKELEGKVQVYLPDMKYALSEPAARYSNAPDYPETAKKAILEMYRQVGKYELDGDGIIKKGVIIRHLVLPENIENTLRVIDWVSEAFSRGEVLFSLMSQYTPSGDLTEHPELRRRITGSEYGTVSEYLNESDIFDGYFQELSSAAEEYIPPFDLTGV